ncbi:MAG TPA: hypothetical protein EYQ24_17725, partial [Bacteroidetes bacterium]|nr:hypothetical protein [Bacteroidota bacterium]
MPRLLLLCALAALTTAAAAQSASFEGRVTVAETGEPLVGATLLLDGTIYGATTDIDGRYRFSAPAGDYALVASFIGYATERRDLTATAGATVREDFALAEAATEVGQVVVTGASRRPERITDSPATVQVLSGADLQQYPGVSYEQALSRLKGVDYVRSGITGFGINARGFNSAFNTKMLLLTDNRRQVLPGAGLPFANMNPVIKEDVERVEVILGPSSALYGPNAHNGTVNVITKDPRNSQGLTIVAEGGMGGADSEVYSARGRYAQAFADNRVAVKVAGEYTGGQDFAFTDTVYVSVPAPTPEAAGFDVILVETVGVGQSELGIMEVADTILVTMIPESGDAIQALKAGIMEIADVLAVNKADQPGADILLDAGGQSIYMDGSFQMWAADYQFQNG